jgi:hypothetical protein
VDSLSKLGLFLVIIGRTRNVSARVIVLKGIGAC